MANTFTNTVALMVESTRGAKEGWCPIYNDPLKDGRRSLKVRHWSASDYAMATTLLESLGCTVEQVTTPGMEEAYRSYGGGWTRLHVSEPAK